MALEFDIGDAQNPKGHALVYFRDSADWEKVYATYVVVFPLPVNIAKYVPPFLASSLGSAAASEISSFPMPPVPEDVENYERLLQLAESRGDDLIFGGFHSETDVPGGMQKVGEIASEYSALWSKFDETQAPALVEEPSEEGLGVNEVMYSLLGEKDRLNELSKLVVKFRYAVEGRDRELREEVNNELKTLARFLPEGYLVSKLIDAAQDSSSRGTRLAQLYLERCYGLSNQDAAKVEDLEREIRAIEDID